ncbi:hypothetical protein A3B05_03625 [Candidatus Giovannonibacteria bacterium RIFCSPLOWO2_01_FULL_43_160]|uniref:Uncharacterized protein n=2 Tax=Candidatus Giovannoniibacteriota TaxID=1752738 RepID=A0A0G1IW17_9BACT|nr:MAG: hypothetical protein UV72_C0003G0022 [Candidatus Giovannonibacteria bacterium GW2011_GWB1_43_13]KKS99265.1 MAG: hypothetical protein UV75_C0007G0022 [Candidatus Giovannonibacteria bacterium GW2011_GWA1_43_15]KKT21086.1 MAG: hypothetical protein UW05_C0018G0017 [Candidatus Giovannonibacteria bacterium GW2011_GWC2_43_8]KKT63148.1 MAG: hypothetical protein UW55_C0006G0017 [Candidatus Giovannonibacteria bacterium GW2011_GWA2_44_26]OGF58209.1 MAG: hypothetical protein A2652_00530 [Candidatus
MFSGSKAVQAVDLMEIDKLLQGALGYETPLWMIKCRKRGVLTENGFTSGLTADDEVASEELEQYQSYLLTLGLSEEIARRLSTPTFLSVFDKTGAWRMKQENQDAVLALKTDLGSRSSQAKN